MANPTCSVATLLTNVPCFNAATLNAKQRLAFMIWFAAKELAVIGGTDYTAVINSTAAGGLLAAETAILKTMNDAELETVMLNIYYKNAVSAGASVSSNPSTLAASTSALCNGNGTTIADMKRMLIELNCQLGRHKNYTQ